MAKKERKEKKNRLKSLVLLLFLTIVLLSTSTYAWFTANRSVSIDPINVQIATSSGLQISTDASNWKTAVSNSDINNATFTSPAVNKNMLPYNLKPVSTIGATKTGGFLDFYLGTVEGASNLGGALGLTAVNTGDEAKYVYDATDPGEQPPFIAFDIFLKADAEEGQTSIPIYLDRGSGVVATDNGKADKKLQYAARYAFVILGNDVSTASLSTLQGKNTPSLVKVVEPNYDAHTDTGVTNASQNYGITTTAASSGVAAVSYLGVKAAITTPVALNSTDNTKFGSVSNLVKTNVAYSTTTDATYSYDGKQASDPKLVNIFNLDPGVTKIRVYMWIEGQDVDCENAASGAYLTYSIGLTLDTPSS